MLGVCLALACTPLRCPDPHLPGATRIPHRARLFGGLRRPEGDRAGRGLGPRLPLCRNTALLAIQDARNGGVLKLPRPGHFAGPLPSGRRNRSPGHGRHAVRHDHAGAGKHNRAGTHHASPAEGLLTTGVAEYGAPRRTGAHSGHGAGEARLQHGRRLDYCCPGVRNPTGCSSRARPGAPKANLDSIRKGDTVRATGIALQYSPTTPYNTGYELLVADIGDVVPIERPPAVPQPVIATGITAILLVGFFLWSRERRLRAQRRRLRRTYKLGEEILGASSAATILKRISEALPGHHRRHARAALRLQPHRQDARRD